MSQLINNNTTHYQKNPASSNDPVAEIRRHTQGKGVDVALEMIGLPLTMKQAVQSLAVMGRAVITGISSRPLEIDTYTELLGKEAIITGTNDHLLHELPPLLELVRRGKLDLSAVVKGGLLEGLEAGRSARSFH